MGYTIPKRSTEFEKLVIDEWLTGKIVEVQDRINENKKFTNDDGTTEIRPTPEIRFVFEFDGYSFKHYSRWMTASTGKMSNLFKKYLNKLLPDLVPGDELDVDKLKGMSVKVMWDENEYNGQMYQNVAQIRPL